MTITPRALVDTATVAALPRFFPTRKESYPIAAHASSLTAVTLPVGTIMTYNTSTNLWQEAANGGANGTGIIMGIIVDVPIYQNANGGGESLGVIATAGEFDYRDLLYPGFTLAQLKVALRTQTPSLRELGIFIVALDQVR